MLRLPAVPGDGIIKIEMQFLPDVYVPCEVCKGRRYNRETLEVRYKGKNIAEVPQMTVEEREKFIGAIGLQLHGDFAPNSVCIGPSAHTISKSRPPLNY